MMRWLWLLSLLVGMGSAHAAAPRWEDIPLPASGQALVDTTGTLKPDTFEAVNQLAAGLSEQGHGRLVVVVIPSYPDDLRYLANELYDSWRVAGEKEDGAVLVIALEHLSAGVSPGWNLGSWDDFDAVRNSAEKAMRAETEPDRAVRAATRVFSQWMARAYTPPKQDPGPFAAFHRPHALVADPDQLLTPELTRTARDWQQFDTYLTLVVYDRVRHPVETRALAEHVRTAWSVSGWLVVLSIHPADAWVIPNEDFGEHGGYWRGLPQVTGAWKQAMERLGDEPSGSSTAEAWNKALEETRWLASYPSPSWEDEHKVGTSSLPWKVDVGAFALAVVLFLVARTWIFRLREGKGPRSIPAFVLSGLLYTTLYGCALGWVLEQSLLLGVFSTFFSFPLVFMGVRRLAAYFGFDPFYYLGSGCAFAALGLFFTLVAFSSELFLVGPVVRTVELHELPRVTGGAFHLRGATLRRDFSANQRLSRQGSTVDSAKLAPLVPEGWTPEQPVPAWLLCRDDDSFQEECRWGEPLEDVVVPSSLGVANTIRLIEGAELVTALRSAPGARLLSRSDDAGASVFRVVRRAVLLPLFFMGVFVFFAVLGHRWDEARAPFRSDRFG
ncbi:TPM domain-containing protein [Archangium lipolyticum]|uniref:TPM domain-containing protein n=1 Tax=Archangium lipolyticum TaxID=2970465 RepID=UPI00214A1852|nr:TPM domain-containing protein [Archangium lipolyticum]